MAHQQQLRGGTATDHASFTGVQKEVTFDTTSNRLRNHNGSRVGGFQVPNSVDIQQNKFCSAAATGTNDVVLTLIDDPGSPGAGMKVSYKQPATNTGAMRANINGYGLTNIKKYSSGSKVAIDAGDLTANMMVDLTYDGSEWIATIQKTAPTLIAQSNLKTSSGVVSATSTTTYTNLLLPGGGYGFYPQIYYSVADTHGSNGGAILLDTPSGSPFNSFTSPGAYISLKPTTTNAKTIYASQIYVLSSPPFDLGDGEVAGFLYLLLNEDDSLAATYFARVPPWAYNGPSQIRADYIDPESGRKFRRRRQTLSALREGYAEKVFRDVPALFATAEAEALAVELKGCRPKLRPQVVQNFILDHAPAVREACLQRHFEEITDDIKNADMGLIPHPFVSKSPEQRVVLVNPRDDRLAYLFDGHDDGDHEIMDAISRGLITINQDTLNCATPPGVDVHRLEIK